MNLLDILMALPLCWLIFVGWKKGLVRELTTLVGVLLGIWASLHYSQQVAPLIGLDGESAVLIAFIVLFLASLVVAYLIGKAVEGLMKAIRLSIVNRLLGALLGACKALIVLSVILSFVLIIDSKQMLLTPKTKQHSLLYQPVSTTGNWLTAQLKDYIHDHSDEWKQLVD